MSSERIIGIDPGSSMSGLCVTDNDRVIAAFNLKNPDLWDKLTTFLIHSSCTVVLEVIRPYSKPMDDYVVQTIEFIGEAKFRIRMACGENLRCVSRFEIKKWVFDTFPDLILPLVAEKIDKKLFDACEVVSRETIRVDSKGKHGRKPSFAYVDDKMVAAAMAFHFGIDKINKVKGFSSHSIQASALCAYVKSVNNKKPDVLSPALV